LDTLNVELGARSYPILIGAGLIDESRLWREQLAARDLLIVSNTTVAPLYLAQLARALAGRRTVEVILPDGEAHKTLANVARVIDVLVANRFARDCALVALGGGVVGDLAGFAAACYQRGVAFVQVPTTLLAQVDSAVGGKTGVNHVGGKNLIGAFHQPVLVVSDTRVLATLPARELRAGIAEIIKYALISDASLFAWLETHLDELLAGEPAAPVRSRRPSSAATSASRASAPCSTSVTLSGTRSSRRPATANGCTARRSVPASSWPRTCQLNAGCCRAPRRRVSAAWWNAPVCRCTSVR
jgi:3-dehydroquinate synthase